MTFAAVEMRGGTTGQMGRMGGGPALVPPWPTGDIGESVAFRDDADTPAVFEDLVGTSPALHATLALVGKVAPPDSTALIGGETGTGKGLVARAIQRRSRRAARPFVSVNCAAIPAALIASELFGHERGAFTGASQRRLGRFELAAGGTLFLDEVGELPPDMQIALLRVLQEREFERVGSNRTIHADVRVIAATNRDLEAAIDAREFRSDLFYRLNVFPIEVPPLRDRRDDIRMLVEYFARHYAHPLGKTLRRISRRTLDLIESHPWPGNVRQLQNVVQRAVIVCDSDVFSIDESWLGSAGYLGRVRTEPSDGAATLEGIKRPHVIPLLEQTNWTLSGPDGAAVRLGLKRTTLQSMLKRLGIASPSSMARSP